MLLQIIQQILGIFLFFIPGVFLSYIVSPKTSIIKKATFSIIYSVSISVILGFLLHILNLLNAINIIISLIFLDILLLLIILNSEKKYKTNFDKAILYIIAFSLIGSIWKWWFLSSIKNFGDAYAYAGKFIGKTIPDLGIYTGMAIDHSKFLGSYVFTKISEFLFISKLLGGFFGIFLITFLFLSFIYLIFSVYRGKKLAFFGVGLMSLGPIEIFHSTLGFFGHSFSYLALFSLFLLYKSDDKNYFYISLLLNIIMMLTYFTSIMINTLSSVGFIIALFLKDLYRNRNIKKTIKNFFKNKKILFFLLIIIISLSFIFLKPLKESTLSNIELVTKHITSYPVMKYEDPTFLGLSAIRWQMLFFFLCGLTFIFHIIKKRFNEENLDIFLCLVPILIVSFSFLYANLPTRIFDFFAFFSFLLLKIQKKYLKIFFVLSFGFLLITGIYVAKNKKIFFETSDKEIQGAEEIAKSLKGKIFSDQVFINHLVLNNYYHITGAYDDDPRVHNLFYQNNTFTFLTTIKNLSNSNINYIAITKRMREKYILMVNVPQKPLININLYEENLKKIYDNGDVIVYEINRTK